ncbi:hypothetical protein CYMTET_7800 [Cymbomonas tetramitiformis]|uniref:DNA topoisomerase n=1 Tax=Cymbomonas tetramitiformis TaxID=36881 RepID=A0AAE0GUY6_9CHLO|nr:hypothetical protein CYMTET_7800 [Cymbomonas tetramitiformis]
MAESELAAEIETLCKEQKKRQRNLYDIQALEVRKKSGEVLQDNQLAKLALKKQREDEVAEIQERRRAAFLKAPAELCERYGVCANCGVPGHTPSNCPRSVRPKARQTPRPATAQGTMTLKAGALPAPALPGNGRAVSELPAAPSPAVPVRTRHIADRALQGQSHQHEPPPSPPCLKDRGPAEARVPRKVEACHGAGPDPYLQERSVEAFGRHNAEGGTELGATVPRVLCVAEKPSVASAIAEALSGGRKRTRSNAEGHAPMCRLHDFFFHFPPAKGKCSVTVTSVIGHLHSMDFNEYTGEDPGNLYGARVRKIVEESTASNGIEEHILAAAQGCDFLYLWLDCDREGENICMEVLNVCRSAGLFSDCRRQVWRAHFSALTESAIRAAYARPGRINEAEAAAVDARQEMDLKVGCSFTRLLTRRLLEPAKITFANPRLRVLSFGPCQSPTLFFCVERHDEIAAFVPRKFWQLTASISVGNGRELPLEWTQGRTFDGRKAQMALASCQRPRTARLLGLDQRWRNLTPPSGLNTVAMLTATSNLGMSPQRTMQVAEKLYMAGFISYPRTESSRYPASFDLVQVVQQHTAHPQWGAHASALLEASPLQPPKSGVDVGDHPPITPMRCATRHQVHGEAEWKVYELVARTFLGSLMPPCRYLEKTALFGIGPSETFSYVWHSVSDPFHFGSVLPWRMSELRVEEDPFWREQIKNREFAVTHLALKEGMTEPPPYLKEAELITLMDKNGIGTDASIPTHITNIIERMYVMVADAVGNAIEEEPEEPGNGGSKGRGRGEGPRKGASGSGKSAGGKGGKGDGGKGAKGIVKLRHLRPTALGVAVIEGFRRIDRGLVQPDIRRAMEHQVTLIAKGQAEKRSVVDVNLALYYTKYTHFQDQLALLYPLFVSEEARDKLGEDSASSHKGAARKSGTSLKGLSDRHMAQLDDQADVKSALVSAEERRRREESRLAAAQTFNPQSAAEDIHASLFDMAASPVVCEPAGISRQMARLQQQGHDLKSGNQISYQAELGRLQQLIGSGAVQTLQEGLQATTIVVGGLDEVGMGGERIALDIH